MKPSFTKGNWKTHIGGYCHAITGDHGMRVHIEWGDNYPHEGRANTRLMAASRELYNALELFVAHYSEPDCPVARDVYNRALAALDKARNGDA